jgi:membrane dipeptidase
MYSEMNDKMIVVDAHNDTMMKVINSETLHPVVDIGLDTSFHIDLPKMRKGQVNIAYFAAYTTDYGNIEKNNSTILASINALRYTENLNADTFRIAKNYAQLEKALSEEKLIGIQTIEGGYAISQDNANDLLSQYADLGVKAIALLWSFSNSIGEGNLEQYRDETPSEGGLTELGKRLITEMENRDMIVDVSHMNERTFWDTVKLSSRPIIASHSGAAAIKPHARNLTDDQLRAVAKLEGVINVVFCRYFIGDEQSGVLKLVDHIEHIVRVVGDDYVGLGSDFDGATMPVDLVDISEMGKIKDELGKRGYSQESIRKIMGLNNLRVLKSTMSIPKRGQELSVKLEHGIYGNMDAVWLTLDEKAYSKLNNQNETIRCLFDGIELACFIHHDTRQIVAYLEQSVHEPYHVVTFEWMLEDERYFCTDVLALK